MENTLIEKIPESFKNSLPINVYFVKGFVNEPLKNKQLRFAKSEFYNSSRMACYNFYKPTFFIKRL